MLKTEPMPAIVTDPHAHDAVRAIEVCGLKCHVHKERLVKRAWLLVALPLDYDELARSDQAAVAAGLQRAAAEVEQIVGEDGPRYATLARRAREELAAAERFAEEADQHDAERRRLLRAGKDSTIAEDDRTAALNEAAVHRERVAELADERDRLRAAIDQKVFANLSSIMVFAATPDVELEKVGPKLAASLKAAAPAILTALATPRVRGEIATQSWIDDRLAALEGTAE